MVFYFFSRYIFFGLRIAIFAWTVGIFNGARRKKKIHAKSGFWLGSNSGPNACEGNALTTGPRRHGYFWFLAATMRPPCVPWENCTSWSKKKKCNGIEFFFFFYFLAFCCRTSRMSLSKAKKLKNNNKKNTSSFREKSFVRPHRRVAIFSMEITDFCMDQSIFA
jgi:hypothetical protein